MQELRLVLRNVGKIAPLIVEDYVAHGGYKGLEKALNLTQEQIIDIIKKSGLRGRGGAGFPTGKKWGFTQNTDADQKYIVCNADEGEPGTNKDLQIMKFDPNSIFEGMAIAGYAIGADYGYIYLRYEYFSLFSFLEEALKNARAKGYLGKNVMGSGFDFDIEIRSGAGAYVCGEETALLESIEGKRGEPRIKPPYPGVAGLWGKPTVVNNVETLANVPQILVNGGEWFKSIGTESCSGTKIFTICGNVAKPGVYEFPFGANLKTIIEEVGGGVAGGKGLLAVQTGGSNGSIIRADQTDIDMDIDNCAKNGVSLGSGSILVIDDSNCLVDVVNNIMEFFVHESCGKCTPCREGNMRLLQLNKRFVEGVGTLKDLEKMQSLSETMMQTALCGLAQTSPIPVVTAIKNFKDEYQKHMKANGGITNA